MMGIPAIRGMEAARCSPYSLTEDKETQKRTNTVRDRRMNNGFNDL